MPLIFKDLTIVLVIRIAAAKERKTAKIDLKV
jgi:hypothetical protein